MKGRLAAAAAICAVLVTGCATTVGGSGVRGSGGDASAGSGQSSGTSGGSASGGSASGGSASAGGQDSPVPPSQSQSVHPVVPSTIRPMPPVNTTDQQPSGDGSASTPVHTTPSAPSTTTEAPSRPSAPVVTTTSPGGGSTSTPGDPVHEFDGAATVDPSSYRGVVTDVGFQSPSGNITCGIQDGTVVCQLARFDYTPPKHDCGASGWGFNFKLAGKSAFLFCAGDVESGGPTLAYGKQITVGKVRCVSRKDGVTCQNTGSGYGFRVARAEYVFFGPNGVATTVGAGGSGSSDGVPSAVVGQWVGHGRMVSIDASGHGTLDYRTYQWCSDDPTPPCDRTKGNEIVSGGHIQFTLTASSGANSATGSVTTSNDPKTPVGEKITVTVPDAYHVSLSIWPDTPFCDPDAPADKWDCGA